MIRENNLSVSQLFVKYKPSIFFLLRFLGAYIIGNLLYGFWVVSYGNLADPITVMVANHSAYLLQLINIPAIIKPSLLEPNVSMLIENRVVVNVYEGCNAINVSILFIAFIMAYKGKLSKVISFLVVGLALIYVFNLFRVSGLFLVAKYFPDHLYLMHKFIFTGVIYAFVFFLWFVWVQMLASSESKSSK